MRLVIDINEATGQASIVSNSARDDTQQPTDAIVYPFYDVTALHTFQTKAEHDDWKRRVAERNENLRIIEREQLASDLLLPDGAFDIRTGDNADAAFEWEFTFELAVFGHVGPMASIHRLHSWIYDGTTELNPEFPNMTGADLRVMCKGGVDHSQYHGPLRALLAKHRNVADPFIA